MSDEVIAMPVLPINAGDEGKDEATGGEGKSETSQLRDIYREMADQKGPKPTDAEPTEPEEKADDGQPEKGDEATETEGSTPQEESEESAKPEEGEADKGDGKPAEPPKAKDDQKSEAKLRERRIQALKRGQYPDDVIASLPDDRLAAIGDKLMKSQAEQDRIGNERANLKKLLAEIEAERKAQPAAKKAADEDGKPPETETGGDDDLVAKLAEWDPDLSKNLAGYIQREVAKAKSELQPPPKEDNNTVIALLRKQVLATSKAQLASEMPQLQNPEVFNRVVKKMADLEQLPSYQTEEGLPDYTEIMRDAAFVVLGKETTQERQQRTEERARIQRAGQMTGKRDGQGPTKGPVSENDRLRSIYRSMAKGK